MRQRFDVLACALLLGACRGARAPEPRLPGETIAVLPLESRSVDVEAPARLRAALEAELAARGYRLAAAREVDEALKGLGVTEGGHLRAVPRQALAASVPGTILCRGEVIEYAFTSALALSRRKVELELRCERKDGSEFFRGSGLGISSTAGSEAAGDAAVMMAGKLTRGLRVAEPVADTELKRETGQAIRRLLDTFPR